jgi:hypothetical protein
MQFHESGLPKDKIVEEAFNYSFKNAMSYKAEELKKFSQHIDMMHMQHLALLDTEKNAGAMKDEDYKREKDMIDKMRDDQLKFGPQMIDEELRTMFRQRRVAPALEILQHGDKSAPELLAAVMLIECVRSPIDYQRITQTFGDGVSGMIAEVHHIDAYPSERNTNLSNAGADTKRAYMALLISSLDQIVVQMRQMAQMHPEQQVAMPPGQEEGLFENALTLWGNDKKLDLRFVDAFNKMATATSSSFRMETGTDGVLSLVKSAFAPPHNHGFPPLNPGKPGADGDDVF